MGRLKIQKKINFGRLLSQPRFPRPPSRLGMAIALIDAKGIWILASTELQRPLHNYQ